MLVRRFRFDREPQGLIVMGVEADSPADRGGLEVGMVITDAANRKVLSLPEFREALASRPAGRDLLVRILKGTKAEFRVILDRSNPTGSGASDPLEPPRATPESPLLEPSTQPEVAPVPGRGPSEGTSAPARRQD